MKLTLGLFLGSLFLIAPSAVSAQPGITRPVLSPYLNLLRGGASAAQNLYGTVIPELAYRSSIAGLQIQGQSDQQALANLANSSVLPPSGHVAGFMTQGPYFTSGRGNIAMGVGVIGGVGGVGQATGIGSNQGVGYGSATFGSGIRPTVGNVPSSGFR